MSGTHLINRNVTSTTNYVAEKPLFGYFILIPLSLVIIVGNILVILASCDKSTRKDIRTRFILGLSIADLVTGVGLAFMVIREAIGLVMRKYLCLFYTLIFITVAVSSQLMLMSCTIDRYLSICRHNKYLMWTTSKKVNIQIICSFCYPAVVFILPFCGLNNYDEDTGCDFKQLYPPVIYLIYSITLIVGMVINILLYTLILKKAFNMHKQKPGMQSSVVHQRQKKDFVFAKLMGIMTVVFTLNWCPLSILFMVLGIKGKYDGPERLQFYVLALGCINSIINPFIYAWNRQDFRKIWRRWIVCTEKNSAVAPSSNTIKVVSSRNT